jgi:hypothetical protein
MGPPEVTGVTVPAGMTVLTGATRRDAFAGYADDLIQLASVSLLAMCLG